MQVHFFPNFLISSFFATFVEDDDKLAHRLLISFVSQSEDDVEPLVHCRFIIFFH